MGYEIIGACILIYLVAFVFRWIVKAFTTITGATPAPHVVRYSTIGAATLLLIPLNALGRSAGQAPDYSFWAYLGGGSLVLAASIAYALWRRSKARSLRITGPTELVGVDPWGYRRPRKPVAEKDQKEERFERLYWTIGLSLIAVVVTVSVTFDLEPQLVPGLLVVIVYELADRLASLIFRPLSLGGLIIGIGIGWMLRGAHDR
jgi:hypothetical protein